MHVLYCLYGCSLWVYHYCMLQDGQTALFEAAGRGHADIVKMLVDYGAVVDIRDEVAIVLWVWLHYQST